MAELAAAVLASNLLAPHLLSLERVTPRSAAAVWLSALFARAAVVLLGAALTLTLLPRTSEFAALAGATWHQAVPLVTGHLDLPGDPLAHAVALGPVTLVVLSIAAFAVGTITAAWRLGARVRRRALGPGPRGSVVIADPRVLVAVSGLGRPQLLVSDTALANLDEAELEAGLAHEIGHVRRGHRAMTLVGGLLATASRALPGSRSCARGLQVSLEREADEYAVARIADPKALASAICKAAAGGAASAGSLGLAAEGTFLRLEQLLGAEARGNPLVERAVVALAVGLTLTGAGALLAAAWLVGVDGAPLALACTG